MWMAPVTDSASPVFGPRLEAQHHERFARGTMLQLIVNVIKCNYCRVEAENARTHEQPGNAAFIVLPTLS
jgi:hypothetical protein